MLMPQRAPNIIFILSDQHRRDWLGCAGSPLVATPHLDQLAANGVRFTQCYCNSPLCGPSRMSLLSGRQPFRNGVYINEDVLDSNVPTFAHALARAGYETVLCGRMHFTGVDQRHGFQKRLVGDICRTLPGSRAVDYGPLERSSSNPRVAVAKAGPGETPVLRYDEDVTRAFERFVRERNDDRPLFATVGWYGPHHPFGAPRELYEQARALMERHGDQPVPSRLAHPWLTMLRGTQNLEITADRIREVRANYAAMITWMDQRIGRVLAAAARMPGETIIVYGSDHGEMALDHGLMGKGSFFEASAGVPLIVSPLVAQTGWARGATVETPVSLVDLAPTLTELAQAPALPQVDGLSLVPLLRNPKDTGTDWANRAIFSELAITYGPQRAMRMIRRGRYKLGYFHGYPTPLLTDVVADPDEHVDLADAPEHAGRRTELLAAVLAGWDAEWIERDARDRLRDQQFIAQFDRETNAGDWHEAWNPDRPVFEFSRSGEPRSWL
jgi:choline-sulfatase